MAKQDIQVSRCGLVTLCSTSYAARGQIVEKYVFSAVWVQRGDYRDHRDSKNGSCLAIAKQVGGCRIGCLVDLVLSAITAVSGDVCVVWSRLLRRFGDIELVCVMGRG